jgi:cellulose synthase (UDP-forming)
MSLADWAPLLAVLGLHLGLAPMLPRRSGIVRTLVAAFGVVVLARYLAWRVPETVLPADPASLGGLWIWGLFVIEIVALLDVTLLWMAFTRRRDRRPEADAHEARLRATDPDALPAVDVFIPTYDEGREILERTIVGATWLDWPRDRLRIFVLDDSDRDWLRDLCAAKGVGYLRREGNAHAKAGNINAALARTDAPYVAVFDADFVPRRDVLMRMMGFFAQADVGIVQAPHAFFNNDPMQANLALRRVLPDDQRLFFDAIMPARDGWDAAFCCGSNAIMRRAALDSIGGRMPTASITEDMLLTLALLRTGWITRYLDERLAVGLAPESLSALFVQRSRWARGAMQILHLRDGPLGPGLPMAKRLLFLPLHWISQSLVQTTSLIVPAAYLWLGLEPLHDVRADAVIRYQLPMIATILVTLRVLAPGGFFPLAQTAMGAMQAFRLLPGVLATLVSPWNLPFAVTPKGDAARGGGVHGATLWTATILLALTAGGLAINAHPPTRIVDDASLIPLVAFWAVFNALVLLIVIACAVSAPARRREERFPLAESAELWRADTPAEMAAPVHLCDASLSGARIVPDPAAPPLPAGAPVHLRIREVGTVPGVVARVAPDGMGIRFSLAEGDPRRDRLIRRLFTDGLDNATRTHNAAAVARGLIGRIFGPDPA